MTKVGFIGLGNVGAKLAATLQRNQVDLWVHDIDPAQAAPFLAQGAACADNPAEMARQVDVVDLLAIAQSLCNGDGGRQRHSSGLVSRQDLDRDEYNR